MNSSPRRHRPFVQVCFLLLLIILGLGWGIEQAFGSSFPVTPTMSMVKTMDPVPEEHQVGLSLYLENCSTCHIPLPPQVLPTESWGNILENLDNHYKQSVPPIIGSFQVLIWNYLRTFSRPLTLDEKTPVFIEESRYFKALHPRVDLPTTVTHQTCLSCHPQAQNFNYRSLNPEWEDAP